MDNFATELIKEVKASAKRWFIACMVILALWFATIGGFLWYISLPADVYDTDIYADEGNANYIGNDMNGDLYNGSEDYSTQNDEAGSTSEQEEEPAESNRQQSNDKKNSA